MNTISKSNYYAAKRALNEGKIFYGRCTFSGQHFHFFDKSKIELDLKILGFIRKSFILFPNSCNDVATFCCGTVEFMNDCTVKFDYDKKFKNKNSSFSTGPIATAITSLRKKC